MPIFKNTVHVGIKEVLMGTDDYNDKSVTFPKLADDVSTYLTDAVDKCNSAAERTETAAENAEAAAKVSKELSAQVSAAEYERVTAEIARKKAEEKRETNTTEALKNAGIATANAEAAAESALDTASHPTKIGEDNYVYVWNKGTQTYDKTNIYCKGEAFSVVHVFNSIAEMEAYPDGEFKTGDFVVINTNDVEQADDAKLYVKTDDGWKFVVDMSGFRGFTGKTPQFSIGETLTLAPCNPASVSIVEDGFDKQGNPCYKVNFGVPKGDIPKLSDFSDEEIAELQKPATDAIELCKEATAECKEVTEVCEDYNEHQPIVGDNGMWWFWNQTEQKYIDSGNLAKGGTFYPKLFVRRNKLMLQDYGLTMGDKIIIKRNKLYVQF